MLTQQQVIDYIRIRESIINQVNRQKTIQSMSMAQRKETVGGDVKYRHFDKIEAAAALKFNMNYKEFAWVKEQIITAQTQKVLREYYRLNNEILIRLDQALNRFKDNNIDQMESNERRLMRAYVAEIKQQTAELRNQLPVASAGSDALDFNIELVSRFDKEFLRLQQLQNNGIANLEQLNR
jgi:hypothetical protein